MIQRHSRPDECVHAGRRLIDLAHGRLGLPNRLRDLRDDGGEPIQSAALAALATGAALFAALSADGSTATTVVRTKPSAAVAAAVRLRYSHRHI